MGEYPPIPEPLDVKSIIATLLRTAPRKGPYIVFTGNQFPKYLWHYWAAALKAKGLTWQDLLRAVSEHAEHVLEWAEGRLSWEELASAIWAGLEHKSKPGRRAGARPGRPKPLTEFLGEA